MNTANLLTGVGVGAALALMLDSTTDRRRRASARERMVRGSRNDEALRHRVRSRLVRVCSHPRAIVVDVHDGNVILRGPILADEHHRVLSVASNVRGVRSIDNELEAHTIGDHVPALEGNGSPFRSRLERLQRNLSPAARALVIASGVAATGMWLASARH